MVQEKANIPTLTQPKPDSRSLDPKEDHRQWDRETAEKFVREWVCDGTAEEMEPSIIATMALISAARAAGEREATERAARKAENHAPSSPDASCERAMRRDGQHIAASIRGTQP